jgi:hypothetical protein
MRPISLPIRLMTIKKSRNSAGIMAYSTALAIKPKKTKSSQINKEKETSNSPASEPRLNTHSGSSNANRITGK